MSVEEKEGAGGVKWRCGRIDERMMKGKKREKRREKTEASTSGPFYHLFVRVPYPAVPYACLARRQRRSRTGQVTISTVSAECRTDTDTETDTCTTPTLPPLFIMVLLGGKRPEANKAHNSCTDTNQFVCSSFLAEHMPVRATASVVSVYIGGTFGGYVCLFIPRTERWKAERRKEGKRKEEGAN